MIARTSVALAIFAIAVSLIAPVANAAITAPTIEVASFTTTTVTFDIVQASELDTLVIVANSADTDSLSGASGVAFNVDPADTTAFTVTGLTPGATYYFIARADSGAGTQAFSARDTLTTYQPRVVSSASVSRLLPQAGTWSMLAPVSITCNGEAGYDSTMWVANAPYVGVHWVTAQDSVVMVGRVYAGARTGDFTAPEVALADTFDITASIGNETLSIPVGADFWYLVVDGVNATNGFHTLDFTVRTHGFNY